MSEHDDTKRISPALLLLGLFAFGIGADRYLDISWKLSLFLLLSGMIAWCVCFARKRYSVAIVCLALAVLFSGAFWHHGRWNWFAHNDISTYCSKGRQSGQASCIRAKVLGEAKNAAKPADCVYDAIPKTERTIFRVAPIAIRDGNDWLSIGGVANLVVHEKTEHVNFGDIIQIHGTVASIHSGKSPGGFDFQSFYRAKNQTAVIHAFDRNSVEVEKRAAKYSNAYVLSFLRKTLNEQIWQYVDKEQAGFASAILLGNREQLGNEKRTAFLTTGTAHLLAISGLHVGILASLFLIGYRWGLLSRRWALLMTIAFVIFYAWLVEFRPPVSRAAILVSLFCLGRLWGRAGNEFNLLALAGFIVLAINPSDLFHLGPQLSFLAFSTLLIFKDWIFPPVSQDPLERLIRITRPAHVRWANKVAQRTKQAFAVSAVIWLIGLPLVAANFHLVTPIGLAVNPIGLIPVAFALFAGLGVCFFGFWLPPVAKFCGMLCGTCLEWTSDAIAFSDRLAFGHWWTAGPNLASLVFYYLSLLVIAVCVKRRERAFFLFSLGWILLCWMLPFQLEKALARNFDGEAKITFIDVGHGSSVLLQLPFGKTVLYDAGSMASADFASQTISNALWSERIEHIDAIVISHADLDHFNAVPQLVERFSVGTVYISVPMKESDAKSSLALFESIEANGVPLRTIAWNDRVGLPGETEIDVLGPPDFGTNGNDNSNSVAILIDVNGRRLLLPGDLEDNGMQILLGKPEIDCDIVMMPHHGSKNSRPIDFAKWSTPELAVISSGMRKLDRDVVSEVEELGCEVLSTSEVGTVRVSLGPDLLSTSTWSNGRWTNVDQEKPTSRKDGISQVR